jgi:hypothetical protein
MNEAFYQKYSDALRGIPAPGIGSGCHTKLLSVANYGVLAGFDDDQICRDIRMSIPNGRRKVPDSEIRCAVARARKDIRTTAVYASAVKTPVRYYTPKASDRTIDQLQSLEFLTAPFTGTAEADIIKLSPVKLDGIESKDHARLLLEKLYHPDEYLFIGDRYSKKVKTVAEWLEDIFLLSNPHIIPNALSGHLGIRKDGKESYRSDTCVKSYRFAILESDTMAIDWQYAMAMFLLKNGFPISAVIDSGNKSLHCWLEVDCKDVTEWEDIVERKLFSMLPALGFDPSCRNEARLSRLPGHLRIDKDRHQRLIYLNPNAAKEA